MYRNKKDVDQHVESLITKLSSKEFFARGYSIGRLYFEVGDYSSCRRYVEQYLSQTDNNAAAHALLGQALQKLGLKEKALEEFKTSYGICPSQKSLVLNICEILADGEVDIDTGRAKYWCDKAETMFPNHPITFKLREKLMSIANPDPEAHATLLIEELAIRPKDVVLHIRLLNLYLKNDKIEEAFTHCCNVEFSETNFINNFEWYKTLAKVLNTNPRNTSDWNFQLLLLTVTERMCSLSLTDLQNITTNSLDAIELLHVYDQALDRVANSGIDAGYREFHTSLLQHHRSQFAFLAATFLLKKCKDKNWTDVKGDAATLMLIAWHSSPFDLASTWVNSSPMNQQNAARRWYCEGSFRCSQAGHYILSYVKNSQSFLDCVSQTINGTDWKGELYGRIFSSKYHLQKNNTSHLLSESFNAPSLRLPKISEVQMYDEEAQRAHGNSLHHYVWLLLNYKDFSLFKCTTFEALPLSNQNNANCFPESLCQLDVYAFLYCAALTSNQNRFCTNISTKPEILPANITEMLCTLAQMKWWDCAFKFSRNELGTEMTDILATLSRGIEIVRCIDYHGLDPELLWKVGCIFQERAKNISDIDEKRSWNLRAVLYFSAAIPLLEKVRRDIHKSDKSMFEYTSNSTLSNDSNLLEECKLNVVVYQLDNGEYEKAINLLENLKSARALYYLAVAYKKMALDENSYKADNTTDEGESKFRTLMSKAQSYGAEAINKLKNTTSKSNNKLYMEAEELFREIETHLNGNNSILGTSDNRDKNSSDEFISLRGHVESTPKSFSTPKRQPSLNSSNYRTPAQFLENKLNEKYSEHIKRQTSNLQQNETMESVMELYKNMFEENRVLGAQIINTMKNMTDQFALLRISVDQVKNQIDECKNECKDVSELKKQIAELKKDITRLKKASSEQAMVENELLNLGEEYRVNENASTYATQMPFTAQQVMPPFNQRLIPPFSVPANPFQMYGQNLFNLYNQYSQFSQGPPVPGAPLFDAARSQVNYPGVFPTPDQMYLDVVNLVQQAMPTAPTVPVIPTPPAASIIPPSLPVVTLSHSSAPTTTPTKPLNLEAKDIPKSMPIAPANVVISSSEHISTTVPTILNPTTPPKNGKGIPHNYQIQMPEMKLNKTTPTFSFPTLNKSTNSQISTFDWNTSKAFNSPNTISTTAAVSCSPNRSTDEMITGPANGSHNKTRTTSEKSNTSVDNYDPCPDFKPIIPLPAEIKVTTGEENECVIFSARAKLYRFVDNQWKERGLGEMKLLKHKDTGKVRVLMRREQIHKICANHIITPNMEIKPMKNETKAYFWVANDFADEKLVLEKFSIRFKTADIAKQFYETFNKARLETDVSNKDSQLIESKSSSDDKTIKSEVQKSNDKEQQPAKTVFGVGGFTFSSTPAFKPVDEKTTVGVPFENSAPTKVNVFSGLQFKTGTSSLFSNLVTTQDSVANKNNNVDQEDAPNKSNVSSEYVEDFEPTVEFKPVIPMLALVDTKTGEEDEIVLFEHRAKLLRFSAPSKEWKERGIGNIKILANKENDKKIRLLMRREQVMKICCNHFLTKEMIFQNMPNMDKAVTWCAQDFSEGELTTETLCLRFKTKQACDAFLDAVKQAQSKLKDESKAAKEEKNAAKQISQPGITSSSATVSNWGDKFRPKQGSWECKECLVRNDENVVNCSACNARNPQVINKTKTTNVSNEVQFKFGVPSQPSNDKPNESLITNTAVSGWGDKFKPKQGSWECEACFVRNNPNVEICTACNTSRYGGAKPETKTPFSIENKFKFGIPQPTKDEQPKVDIKPSWGDMFKASAGTWECKNCYVRNEFNVEICCSCNNLKDSGVATKPSNVVMPATFGSLHKNEASSIFDGTGVYKFNFGIAANAQGQSSYQFPKLDNNAAPSNLVQLGSEGSGSNNSSEKPVKTALLPTPQKASDTSTFDFVFKPKTQTNAKSPGKPPVTEEGDQSDGNEYASEDEGHHIKITPIVPLPDKVKVVTGEEDEDELFGHRAKLLIFVSGEWKERGIGVVKILRHKHTAKLRVVMRREQVFKICLNHALTPEIIYNLKDEKNWIFAANDFSEGELSLQRFCLKFKTKEIALDFKNAIDMARSGKNDYPQNNTKKEGKDSDEVQFITETQSNVEEKKKAKDLMLPENFYLYKDKEPCPGCRGCADEHNAAPAGSTPDEEPAVLKTTSTSAVPPQTIPVKSSLFGSSIFTSSNSQNIFKIPHSIDPKNQSNKSQPVPSLSQTNSNNKVEKSLIQQPKLSFDTTKSINKSALETPFGENEGSDPKSLFSTANAKITNKLFDFKPNGNSNSPTNIPNTPFNSPATGVKSNGKSIFGGMTSPMTFFKGFGSESKENSPSTNEGMRGFMPMNSGDDKTNIPSSNLQFLCNKPDTDGLSFNAISNRPEISFQSSPDFKWEGAGQQLFANTPVKKANSGSENDTANDGEEEYDPHYEPIVDLPDKIVVTTGEEDEEKLFGEHCKLYRFSEGAEWKERGVGELKVLYHPEKKTYRLLLRRQQVHKVVLNMLLNCDFELRPMKSDRSWMFAGRNFVDGATGDHETLAARFKDNGLANRFKETVDNSVRKLQSLAAQAIREQQSEEEKPKSIAHLRLPKHLQDSARADSKLVMDPMEFVKAGASEAAAPAPDPASDLAPVAYASADSTAEDLTGEDEAYHYDQEDEYEGYDNEEEEDRVYFSCDCEAEFQKGEAASACARAHVQVLDAAYAPKIMVSNAATGQLLCEMLILDDLEIELSDNTCSWLGTDFFTSNDPTDTYVTVHFPDTETAVQFYNSCEECKGNSAAADEES